MLWRDLKKRIVDPNQFKVKKLINALKRVAPHVPHHISEDLFIYAPETDVLGAVFTIHLGGNIMYLRNPAPKEPQHEVDFTVAHEFAHLILRHPQDGKRSNKRTEKAADDLAKSWGFSIKR